MVTKRAQDELADAYAAPPLQNSHKTRLVVQVRDVEGGDGPPREVTVEAFA